VIGDGRIRYMPRPLLERSGLTGVDFVPSIEEVFRMHADGECLMPDHIYVPRPGGRFCNGMVAWVPKLGFASGKLQMGDPANLARGRPQIQGLLTLFDDRSAMPVAILEAGWITAMRSVAVSAALAARLAPPGSATVGLVGAGQQARLHYDALPLVLPGLARFVVHDILPERAAEFARWAEERPGPPVEIVDSPETAVRTADVLMTATVIVKPRRPFIKGEWLKPDCLVLSQDRDCCFEDCAMGAFDMLVSDDRHYFEHARANEGSFAAAGRLDADLAELVARSTGATPARGRIGSFVIGVPISDLAAAVAVWRRLPGIGDELSF
jgi:alanine dehydrogenase